MNAPIVVFRILLVLAPLFASRAVQAQARDTIRVRADGPPPWGPNVRLVQELAIGQTDGPPEYAFGRIYFAAPEPSGAFYLFDANDSQIRRYDATGHFTGLVGRKGGGPGEYQFIGGMAVDKQGRLVVFDPESRRISHFGIDGKLLNELTINRSVFNDFYIDSAGTMYLVAGAGGRLMEGPGAQQMYLRLSSDGKVLDSLRFPRLTAGTPPMNGFGLSTSDGMRSNFVDANLVAPYLSGGLIAARSLAYRVIVSDGARRVMVIERAYRPVDLGGEERSQWLEWADTLQLRGTGRRYDIPRTKPPIRGIRSDHLGRIWVEVYVAAEKRLNLPDKRADGGKQILHWRERTTYDVFSPQGQFLGRIALPEQTVLLAISGNRLYTRGKGPDEEDRLVVLRMMVPDRPLRHD